MNAAERHSYMTLTEGMFKHSCFTTSLQCKNVSLRTPMAFQNEDAGHLKTALQELANVVISRYLGGLFQDLKSAEGTDRLRKTVQYFICSLSNLHTSLISHDTYYNVNLTQMIVTLYCLRNEGDSGPLQSMRLPVFGCSNL
ncbi:rCG43324 [Rattus norvegicus]|uniref:RCG43324 n=1 Tax=Rattus norvegicus TaxID=10116 RepID=A6IVU2_RAT|nr:rCG43324 [Rattus norvegicus]